jgi:hypothetical protein
MRKIADLRPETVCDDPDHEPPYTKTPGLYEHECPTCHRIVRFTVGYNPRVDREYFAGGFDGASP